MIFYRQRAKCIWIVTHVRPDILCTAASIAGQGNDRQKNSDLPSNRHFIDSLHNGNNNLYPVSIKLPSASAGARLIPANTTRVLSWRQWLEMARWYSCTRCVDFYISIGRNHIPTQLWSIDSTHSIWNAKKNILPVNSYISVMSQMIHL